LNRFIYIKICFCFNPFPLKWKCCPVSAIERIRYSGYFIKLKIERNKLGPTKTPGFRGVPVLRGSCLEGFYCTYIIVMVYSNTVYSRIRTYCIYLTCFQGDKIIVSVTARIKYKHVRKILKLLCAIYMIESRCFDILHGH